MCSWSQVLYLALLIKSPLLVMAAPQVADLVSAALPLGPADAPETPEAVVDGLGEGSAILWEGRMLSTAQLVGVLRLCSLRCWPDPWCTLLHCMLLSFIPVKLLQCLRSSCLFCIVVLPSPVLTIPLNFVSSANFISKLLPSVPWSLIKL